MAPRSVEKLKSAYVNSINTYSILNRYFGRVHMHLSRTCVFHTCVRAPLFYKLIYIYIYLCFFLFLSTLILPIL